MPSAKPFLKWAGGKQHLATALLRLQPERYNRYYEPFLGSAAFFFNLNPEQAVLGDLNSDLVDTYKQVQINPSGVIVRLRRMRRSERSFYRIRNQSPTGPAAAAARLIYLNRNCWNGLYRVNSSGQFNVPYGRYHNPRICDVKNLLAVSCALSKARLVVGDFEDTVASARKGDLVYLDPPYRTIEPKNGFLKYNATIFSWEDQLRLARVFRHLDRRGCHVILTNANHTAIRNLYRDFTERTVERMSLIAANSEKRRPVSELLVTNY